MATSSVWLAGPPPSVRTMGKLVKDNKKMIAPRPGRAGLRAGQSMTRKRVQGDRARLRPSLRRAGDTPSSRGSNSAAAKVASRMTWA